MLIDINTHAGRWPFLQSGPTEPAALEDELRAAGITRAMVSAIESVLAPHPSIEEQRLHPRLSDFFSHAPLISPMLFDWRDRLRQARDEFGATTIRLLPSYHRYEADGDEAAALVEAAAELNLHVAVLVRIEDERAHYPLMAVPAPTEAALLKLADRLAPRPLILLNAYRWELPAFADRPHVCFDLPYLESEHPFASITAIVPPSRLLFASHAPLMYPIAQRRKLDHGELSDADRAAVAAGNAIRLGLVSG